MRIYGRLLLTAAAVLALPVAASAAPPVVIGDGSVCIDVGGGPALGTGRIHNHKLDFNRIVIDTQPQSKLERCKPREDCGADTATCRTLPRPAKSLVVTYSVLADDDVSASEQTITVTYDATAKNLALSLSSAGGLREFQPHHRRGRRRVSLQGAAIRAISIDGNVVEACENKTCRVTLSEKPLPAPAQQNAAN